MIPMFGVLEGVGGEGDIRRDHATLQVRACSRDGRRPNNHETCSLDGAWVWYPIEKRVRKFRQGFPRLCGPRKLRYCTGGGTPGLGGTPPYAGVRRSAPGRRGGSGPGWPGAVLGARAALDFVPGRALSAGALPAPSAEWFLVGCSAAHAAAPRQNLDHSCPTGLSCHS